VERFDLLILFVTASSLFLFIREPSENYGGPGALKIYEGEPVPGGREGVAELAFVNTFDGEVRCDVTVSVRQWFSTKYENSTSLTFPPGRSLTNVSIFLPDGRNEVVVDARC
jgi:hypothetical protein